MAASTGDRRQPDRGGLDPGWRRRYGPGLGCLARAHPDANRVELAIAHSHAHLAEHREVLAIVERLVEESRVPAVAERPRDDTLYGTAPAPATPTQVEAFVRDVRTSQAGRDDPRANDPAIWRGLYRELKR